MRLWSALCRYLQFRLAPDPVENPSRQEADAQRAVDYCGIVIVDEADFDPGLLTAPIVNSPEGCAAAGVINPITVGSGAFVEPPHSPSISGKARHDHA